MLNHRPPRRLLISLVAALSLGAAASRLLASPPTLLADLGPGRRTRFPEPHDFVSIGGVVVYVDRDLSGQVPALWRTNGTAAGTRPLATLVPSGEEGRALGVTGGRAFFASGFQFAGDLRLWATDGTWRGTVLLTPRPLATQVLWQATAGGGHLYLTGCTRDTGCSFWSSDGTPVGTRLQGTLPVNGQQLRPDGLVALDEIGMQLVRGPDSTELVTVDPDAGARPIASFLGTPAPRLLTAAGGRVFFIAPGGDGKTEQLWASDGTVGFTRPATAFTNERAFARTFFLEPVGDEVWFLADDGIHGAELWASDGSATGTRRITDFLPADPWHFYGSNSPVGGMLGQLAGRTVFAADAGQGPQLWSTGGTAESTQPLRDCPGGCPLPDAAPYFARLGEGLLFPARDSLHGRELWITDGTGPGTRLVADVYPGPLSNRLRFLTPVGRWVIFQSFVDEDEDSTLWVTDGTAAGTRRLALGGPRFSPNVYPPPYVRLDAAATSTRLVTAAHEATSTRLVTAAHEDDGPSGLWRFDGTPSGTGPLRAVPFAAGSSPSGFAWLGDRLLARIERSDTPELVALDGSGTKRLLAWPSTFPSSTTVVTGGRAVLTTYGPRAGDGSDPVQIAWGTDGTPGGTVALTTLAAYPNPPVPSTRWGAVFVSFVAEADYSPSLLDPTTIMRTNGTPAGTRPLVVLPPRLIPNHLTEVGGRLYFTAYEYDRDGLRVWTSDGTTAGTRPLFAGSTESYHPPHFQPFSGGVSFLALGADGMVGLWRSDGTVANTALVTPLVDYAVWGGAHRWSFTAAGAHLYYWAPESPKSLGPLRPWVSDSTPAGTRPLAEVELNWPRIEARFVTVGGTTFFVADDGLHGDELWATDGTPETTRLAVDLWPGPTGSEPSELTACGDRLVWVAHTLRVGSELRSLDLASAVPALVADIAPGPSWSDPWELSWDDARGTLTFSADDGVHGREPWAWTPAGGAPALAR